MSRYFVFLLVFSYPTFPPKNEEESAWYLTGLEIRRHEYHKKGCSFDFCWQTPGMDVLEIWPNLQPSFADLTC